MIGLPAALAPWAEELARLPTDLALALAPWVGRLALAVGPMAEARHARSGEPDGFMGLARRGSYERLITTEWAVAELYPDEFARRAAAGEHMFLELARRGHHAARWTVAVVSAGPEQLGAPRLAHLAMLIVLARRAAAAGATFSWGVLEDRPRLALIGDVNALAVRRLLDARTADAGGAEAVAAWRDALHGDADVEIWWIGGATDLATARAAGDPCVIVHDVLEPGVRALDVEVARRGTPARVRLALPAADDCARLLREPISKPARLGRTAPLGGRARHVRFGAGARRLLVECIDGNRIESWPMPNSPRAQIGKSRQWRFPDGHLLLALGSEERATLCASMVRGKPNHTYFTQAGALEKLRIEFAEPPLRWEEAPGRCAMIDRHGQPQRLTLAYGGGLYEVPELLHHAAIRPPFALRQRHQEGSIVLASALSGSRMQWIEQRPDGKVVARIDPGDGNERSIPIHPPAGHEGPPLRASFGFDTERGDGWPLVVCWTDQRCTVMTGDHTKHDLIADELVVGVGRWKAGGLALLVQQDRRHLAWRLAGEHLPLPTTHDDIVDVDVCTTRPYVAWVTTAHDVVLYSAKHHAVLMHLVPEAAEASR